MILYGVLDSNNCHEDTSKTLLGAKQFATRNGYNAVSSRDVNHYYITVEARKINGKWKSENH